MVNLGDTGRPAGTILPRWAYRSIYYHLQMVAKTWEGLAEVGLGYSTLSSPRTSEEAKKPCKNPRIYAAKFELKIPSFRYPSFASIAYPRLLM